MAVTFYSGFVPVCVQLLTGLKTVLTADLVIQSIEAIAGFRLRFRV